MSGVGIDLAVSTANSGQSGPASTGDWIKSTTTNVYTNESFLDKAMKAFAVIGSAISIYAFLKSARKKKG